MSITIPGGWVRDVFQAIRNSRSAQHAVAADLWGYNPADVPASRVVVDLMILGLRQIQVEMDAESYHAAAQDPERAESVAFLAANLLAVAATEESRG